MDLFRRLRYTLSRNRLYYDIGLTACQLLCISRNDIAIPLKYSTIKKIKEKYLMGN